MSWISFSSRDLDQKVLKALVFLYPPVYTFKSLLIVYFYIIQLFNYDDFSMLIKHLFQII